jgi:hypothetical protein
MAGLAMLKKLFQTDGYCQVGVMANRYLIVGIK